MPLSNSAQHSLNRKLFHFKILKIAVIALREIATVIDVVERWLMIKTVSIIDEAPFGVIAATVLITAVGLGAALLLGLTALGQDFTLERIDTAGAMAKTARYFALFKKALKLAVELSKVVLVQFVTLDHVIIVLKIVLRVVEAHADHIGRNLGLLPAAMVGGVRGEGLGGGLLKWVLFLVKYRRVEL